MWLLDAAIKLYFSLANSISLLTQACICPTATEYTIKQDRVSAPEKVAVTVRSYWKYAARLDSTHLIPLSSHPTTMKWYLAI